MRIVDLSTMMQDPLEIKLVNGELFTIPGEINTDFVLRLSKKQQDLREAGNDFEKQLKGLHEMVLAILQLDETKDVDLEYVKKNIKDVRYLKIIMEATMDFINNIQNDPN